MDTAPTTLTRCLDEVLAQLIAAHPLPAQLRLQEGLEAARVSRGLVQHAPYTLYEADAKIATLCDRVGGIGSPWEALTWAVYAFGCGRDEDVARVLLDGQDRALTAPLHAVFADNLVHA